MLSEETLAPPPQDFGKLRDLILDAVTRCRSDWPRSQRIRSNFPDDIAFGTVGRIPSRPRAPEHAGAFRQSSRLSAASANSRRYSNSACATGRTITKPGCRRSTLHASGLPPAMALIERSSARPPLDRSHGPGSDSSWRRSKRRSEVLARAETIYLIGQRRSYPITSYLGYVLGTLGVRNVLAGAPNGTDRETLSFAGPRDAALAVGFTPYAPVTIDFMRQIDAKTRRSSRSAIAPSARSCSIRRSGSRSSKAISRVSDLSLRR